MGNNNNRWYFIYAKGPGEKRFTVCDPNRGKRGINLVFAPRFHREDADKVVTLMTEGNPGFVFQRRSCKSCC